MRMYRALRTLIFSICLFTLISGCQVQNVASRAQLTQHFIEIEKTGLDTPAQVAVLETQAAFPLGWMALPVQKAALYTHQQWRSPTKRTAVGITYVRMPLPLSTKTLVWFATNEAGKKVDDGKILRQWRDGLGREWFEAENAKYHMVGYVMTRGFDAWINYAGYRVSEPKDDAEYDLATRSLDTIMPLDAKVPMKTEFASKDK
jgi:hypothetical protein